MSSDPATMKKRRRLGILTEEFGAYSTMFVQRQLDALHLLNPFIACWLRSNQEIFDYEPVHVLRNQRRRFFWLRRMLAPVPKRYAVADIIEANAELARCLDLYQPEMLHIHFGWAAARTVRLLTRRRIPYTLVIHGSDLNAAYRVPTLPYARRLARAMKNAARCLFVSEDLKAKGIALGCPEEKAQVFYLGVPIPARQADPGSPGPVRITANGRLIEWKGHTILVQAFAKLVTDGLEAELTVIGEGPLRDDLEREAKELGVGARVRFLACLSNEEVYAELQRSHILAHPSRLLASGAEEGLGLAVQEGMAAGLPVVATRTGGIPESVEDGETGILVPHSDVAAMAEALESLASDASLRERMGRAGRERVETHFNLDRQNQRLLQLFRELLQVGE
jgi:glycosyltransferase involved in cell wall biosynthesis